MAEEKKEPWLNWLALTTVILAVCATLSTFKGGGYSTRAVMSQSQASDQWAYFQAKGIKQYIYQMQKERLELELKGLGRQNAELRESYRKRIDDYGAKIATYDAEKAAVKKDAEKYEQIRNRSQQHSQAFGIAVIFLQIAILLSSIAALMKKKLLWVAGCLLGVLGIVQFVNGFFLFF